MNRLITRTITCFLAACAMCVADGESPSPSASPAAEAPAAQPAKQQPLSKQIESDCYNRRRLAIRAVNLKYIALTQDAATQFTKENNATRADDANTWAKNLAWANDANLKGVAPEVKDRLGELQAAYLKERVNAIVTADNANVDDVEAATKKAQQDGDQTSATELAKLEDRIKQELRSVNKAAAPAVAVAQAAQASPATPAAPTAPMTAAEKMAADYDAAHTEAVKKVNQKYIALAQDAAALYLKESNQAKADEATDWARRLQWTDGGNLLKMSPETTGRLGVLQTAYLRERATAVLIVDRTSLPAAEAAQAQAVKTGDQQGAGTLAKLADSIHYEIGITEPPAPAPPKPAVAVAAAPPLQAPAPQQPAATPPPGVALTPGEQVTASFNNARSDAVKIVNQKYAGMSKQAADLFLGEGNKSRADEAADWARRLDWTDDVGNLRGLAPEMGDRLGTLQKAYLKERATALRSVDHAWLAKIEAAQRKFTPDDDMKGAVSLLQIMDVMGKELGITPPPPPVSTAAASATAAVAAPAPPSSATANAAPTPTLPQPAGQSPASNPFGVTADKLSPP